MKTSLPFYFSQFTANANLTGTLVGPRASLIMVTKKKWVPARIQIPAVNKQAVSLLDQLIWISVTERRELKIINVGWLAIARYSDKVLDL